MIDSSCSAAHSREQLPEHQVAPPRSWLRRVLILLMLVPSLVLADADPIGNAERACGQAYDRWYAPKRGKPTADEVSAYVRAGRVGVVAHCTGAALQISGMYRSEYPEMLGKTYLTPEQLQNVVSNLVYDVCVKNAYQVIGDDVTFLKRPEIVKACGDRATIIVDQKQPGPSPEQVQIAAQEQWK